MKTKNFFSRFSATALLAAAVLLPTALTSCSSEAEPNTPAEDPIPEGMARINLSFSTPEISSQATRGLSDEAALDDLWLYIFDSNGALYKLVDAKTAIGNGPLTTSYQNIYGGSKDGLMIAPGNYKFFMVANLGDYIDDDDLKEKLSDESKKITETELSGLTLNFGSNAETLIGKTSKLPMAANCTDVTVTKDSQTTQGTPATDIVSSAGVVTITDGQYDIKIDMSFLCAAVRYTILFDNSEDGVSQFYKDFTMTSVTAKNMLTSYDIFSSQEAFTSTSTATSKVLDWNQYVFPTGKTIADLKSDPDLLTATEKVNSWTADNHLRAVQGVVYLPENFATQVNGVNEATSTLKTVLDLNYSLDNNELTPTLVLPNTATSVDNNKDNVLARAHYYDVIGVITSSGIEFYVTVKHWTKVDLDAIPF